MNTLQRLSAARTHLLLEQPFFGALAMRLKLVERPDVKTFGTDGTSLFYAPEFADKCTDKKLQFIIAHEVMHCAVQHPFRRGSRDFNLWNDACDHAVNLILHESGRFETPKDAKMDRRFSGMNAEAIYSALRQESADNQQGGKPQGDGSDQSDEPLSTGTVMDAPLEAPAQSGAEQPSSQMTAEDWKIAVEQTASATKAAGNQPGDAVRAAKAARASQEDWRSVLREFVEHQMPSDYSWSTPNRRHIARGLYLPGVHKENLGSLAVIVDTSGTISAAELSLFAAELTTILHEAQPEAIRVIYCDSRVRHEETFTPNDGEIVLDARGGGGTMFQPAFDLLNEADEPPVAAIYFTDLDCYDEPAEPAYPVLWVTSVSIPKDGPFGRTVRIDAWQ